MIEMNASQDGPHLVMDDELPKTDEAKQVVFDQIITWVMQQPPKTEPYLGRSAIYDDYIKQKSRRTSLTED